jgi:hypothetical protein
VEEHPVSLEKGIVVILFDESMKLLAPHLSFSASPSSSTCIENSLSLQVSFTFHLLSLFHHVCMFTIKCIEHTLSQSKHADKAALDKR